MDTILDKLSQKFTAQEIIKANTEADTKALERIQNQVQQYNECLEEMKQVNAQTKAALSQMEKTLQTGLENFKNAEIPTDSITKLVEESLSQMKAFQKDAADMQSILDEKFGKQSEALQAVLEEKCGTNAEITDFVHKECVKVYRNMQAVQVEENNKQTEALTAEIARGAAKGKKAWAVMITTLIFSVLATAGVVFQLLVIFGVFGF